MSQIAKVKATITSTEKTKKITRAMELVAASKLGKTQQRMAKGRPYADKMLDVIRHVAQSQSEYRHPYLQTRPLTRVGCIVISSDRGLCGGLNANLFKATLNHFKQWLDEDIAVDLCLIGSKAAQFFNRLDHGILGHANHLGDAPSVQDIIGVVKVMLDAYHKQDISHVFVAYNRYVNTMVQKPRLLQLLPLQAIDLPDATAQTTPPQSQWDYIYEPAAQEVMDVLFDRYIESQVYQAVVENIACEQAARMMSMKNATENADNIIDDLKLAYNKARQAGITQELSEIVAGSEAVE